MKARTAIILLALVPLAACATSERMVAADTRIAPLESQQREMQVRLNEALRQSTAAKIDAATAMMMAK